MGRWSVGWKENTRIDFAVTENSVKNNVKSFVPFMAGMPRERAGGKVLCKVF